MHGHLTLRLQPALEGLGAKQLLDGPLLLRARLRQFRPGFGLLRARLRLHSPGFSLLNPRLNGGCARGLFFFSSFRLHHNRQKDVAGVMGCSPHL